MHSIILLFFFFNDPATTEIYTLSLHDALPISRRGRPPRRPRAVPRRRGAGSARSASFGCRRRDRKSTRLNSSHPSISYAVFCLKKKKRNYVYRTILIIQKTNLILTVH